MITTYLGIRAVGRSALTDPLPRISQGSDEVLSFLGPHLEAQQGKSLSQIPSAW